LHRILAPHHHLQNALITKPMKKTSALLFCTALLLFGIATHAQVAINSTGAAADESAILDISSSDKGLLIPRVTLTSLGDNINPINNPAQGLMVYNMGGTLADGFYVWNGYNWSSMASTAFVENTMLDMTGSIFGELYEFNEVGTYTVIDLTNDGAWHGWNTATEGDFNFVTPSCVDQPCRLIIEEGGHYKVNLGFGYETNSANVLFDAAICLNGTPQNDLRTREQSVAAQTFGNCTISGIIDLQADDYLDLRFAGSQNKELRLGTVNLNIVKLD